MKSNTREKVVEEISPLSHEINLSIFAPQSSSKSNYKYKKDKLLYLYYTNELRKTSEDYIFGEFL